VEQGTITIEFVPLTEQLADILTKLLGRTKFKAARARLQLVSLEETQIFT
jgi:hypothetical protein